MSHSVTIGDRSRLLVTTALVAPALFGYGYRRAEAACVTTGGGTYVCSGAETVPQIIISNDADVTFGAGATIDTRVGGGDAISILGLGNIRLVNAAGGVIPATSLGIAGATNGIRVFSTGDNGATPGSVFVSTNAGVYGNQFGIAAYNNGSSALTISAVDVTGANDHGIAANNSGSELSITTTGAVQGGRKGIEAINSGSGPLTISAASVAGTSEDGIYATNSGTNLSITTTGAVQGGLNGIYARNAGSGTLEISAAAATGTGNDGIFANNSGTDLTITTTGAVQGNRFGIYARNAGGGTTEITVAAGASVTGGTFSITTDNGPSSSDTINLSGTLHGNAAFGGGDDTVNLEATAGFGAGTILDGGADNDQIVLSGMGDGSLDGATHTNFEMLDMSGSGTWTLTGAHNFATSVSSNSGTLNLSDMSTLISPTVTSAADLAIAGAGAIGGANIVGNFVQTATGTFLVDVDAPSGASDQLTVSGTAGLAGTVRPNFLNPIAATGSATILTAAGGVTNNGLTLAALSPVVAASLSTPNANDVVLDYAIDFTMTTPTPTTQTLATSGLNRNQMEIGNALNSALSGGGGSLSPLFNALLMGITDLDAYLDALNQLSPEIYENAQITSFFAAEEFANDLLSCQVLGSGIAEGECLWARPQGRSFDRDADSQTMGYDGTTAGISVGGQVAITPNWFVGAALGYDRSSVENNNGSESQINRYSIGGAIKYQAGPLYLAGTLSGGVGGEDVTRPISFGGLTGLAQSDHDTTHFAGLVRAAYLFDMGGWYAKPLVDVNVTHLDSDGFTETGAGAANLTVAGDTETIYSVTPAIELGTEFRTSAAVIRPFVKAGATFFDDNDTSLSARFAGALIGTGNFTIVTEIDDVMADIEAGITALHDDGSTLSVVYEGRIGATTEQHGLMLKGSVKY